MQHEYDHDNLLKALEYNNKSISYYTKDKNLDKIAHSIRHRADLQKALGQFENAESNYLKAIRIYKEQLQAFNGNLANALRGYALVLEKRKRFKKAIMVWEEIKAIYAKHQFSEGTIEANHKISQLKNHDH